MEEGHRYTVDRTSTGEVSLPLSVQCPVWVPSLMCRGAYWEGSRSDPVRCPRRAGCGPGSGEGEVG